MGAAYLFDLDQTLVDSDSVKRLRDEGKWDIVLKSLSQVTRFDLSPFSPDEIPSVLKSSGYLIGIVTSSKRQYAEEVLDYFQIPYDTLVAFEDTGKHKPEPDAINLALHNLGVRPENAFYVGDSVNDFIAAYRARVFSVGAGWGIPDAARISSEMPRVMLNDPVDLLDPRDIVARGYFGQLIETGQDATRATTIVCSYTPKIYALNRYFVASDPRHANSRWSQSIIKLKINDDARELFVEALNIYLRNHDFDKVLFIPSKPEETRKRFEQIVIDLDRNGISNLYLDGLKRIKTIEGYKNMQKPDRILAIRGCYEVNGPISGKVLLIDDVCSSGSTLKECSRILKAAGASDVQCLAFGRAQHSLEERACPTCGRAMRIRENRTNGILFWGCSGYPHFCKRTVNL